MWYCDSQQVSQSNIKIEFNVYKFVAGNWDYSNIYFSSFFLI